MKKIITIFCVLLPAFLSAQTLVGSWNFNGNANDASGNGLNGTVYNATLTAGQAGFPNTAYQFNGSSSHIDVPYNSLLDLTTWTIKAVVKIDAFNPSACQEERIVSRGTTYNFDTYALALNDNTHDNSCPISSPNNTEFVAGAAGSATGAGLHDANYITLHTWYCVTTTYDGSKIKMYLNGAVIDSVICSNQYNYTNTQPILSFGYFPTGGANYPYWLNGAIDNISIWNGVLSDAAIANNCGAVAATNSITISQPFIDTVECTGSAFNLTYTKTGVYNAGNTFTAQLSNAAGSFANAVNIGSVTATTAGSIPCTIPAGTLSGMGYRLRVVSSSPADTSATNGVNIHIGTLTPSTLATNGPVCAGDSLKISATNNNPQASYGWTGPNSYTSGMQNVAIGNSTVANGGWYYLSTAVPGCILKDSVNAVVNAAGTPPIVSITGNIPETVCPGTHGVFTVTATNAGTSPVYLWYVNGAFQPGITTVYAPAFSLVDGELIVCKVVNNNAQCVLSDTGVGSITIHVSAITSPVVTVSSSPSVYSAGTTVTFTAHVVGGGPTYGFQWLLNGNIVAGANTSSFITAQVSASDKVMVKVLSVGPCATDSASSNIINVGVQQVVKSSAVTLYPNPNKGLFTITGILKGKAATVEVVNAVGQIVYTRNITIKNDYIDEPVSISGLASGSYYVKITGTESKVLKFNID